MVHLLFLAATLAAPAPRADFRAGGPEFETEAVTCHLPEREHLLNAPGTDGFGLCVFTSLDLAARWANEPALVGLRDYMTKHPGGGWPEKVDEVVPKAAAAKGLPTPAYAQHTGGDPEFLRRALRTGRYVCVTYDGHDGVYYRGRIAHMVNLVHFSDRFAVIQDNNYPGKWLWMSPTEFLDRWRGTGGGWAIVLLKAGPPPVPINASSPPAEQPSCPDCGPEAGGPCAAQGGTGAGDDLNYGLDRRQISAAASYRLNGRDVSREAALAAFGPVPDDRDRLRLTIVGDADLRARVLADLKTHADLAPWLDRLIVQDYAADHWAVADVGFATGVTLQTPPGLDGKAAVLWRLPQYTGPAALAGALRKADPLYRPDRDPDPTKPEPVKPVPTDPKHEGFAMNIPSEVWYGLGGLLVALVAQRLKIPLPSLTRQPADLRSLVREVLLDLLRPPVAQPVAVVDDESLARLRAAAKE